MSGLLKNKVQLYSLNPFNSFLPIFSVFLFSFLVDGLSDYSGLKQTLPVEISDLNLWLSGESRDIIIQP